VKDLIRNGISDHDLQTTLLNTFNKRPKDGFEAEHERATNHPAHESMATIGG